MLAENCVSLCKKIFLPLSEIYIIVSYYTGRMTLYRGVNLDKSVEKLEDASTQRVSTSECQNKELLAHQVVEDNSAGYRIQAYNICASNLLLLWRL